MSKTALSARWRPNAASDFLTGAERLGLHLVVKNTFFDTDLRYECEDFVVVQRRCSSVPLRYKYSPERDGRKTSIGSLSVCIKSDLWGDISRTGTCCSDDRNSVASPSTTASLDCINPLGASEGVLRSSAAEFVPSSSGTHSLGTVSTAASPVPRSPKGSARLNPEAHIFQPGRVGATPLSSTPMDAEMKAVLFTVVQALRSENAVQTVTLSEGCMGSATIVGVAMHRDALWRADEAGQRVLQAAKHSLLQGAEHSSTTYIMGYELAPFVDDSAGLGFQVTLGTVLPSKESIVCWEAYRRGYCSHQGQCHLCHPSPRDLATVRVVIPNT